MHPLIALVLALMEDILLQQVMTILLFYGIERKVVLHLSKGIQIELIV